MSTIVHHLPTKLGAVKKLLGGAEQHPQDVKDAGLMGEKIISKKIRGGRKMISGGPETIIELKSNCQVTCRKSLSGTGTEKARRAEQKDLPD